MAGDNNALIGVMLKQLIREVKSHWNDPIYQNWATYPNRQGSGNRLPVPTTCSPGLLSAWENATFYALSRKDQAVAIVPGSHGRAYKRSEDFSEVQVPCNQHNRCND